MIEKPILWFTPTYDKSSIPPLNNPRLTKKLLLRRFKNPPPLNTYLWDNPIESGDVLALKAKKFVELVKDGGEPDKVAKKLGTSVAAIKKTRPEILEEVREMIDTYGNMPKEIRRAYVRAGQLKLAMRYMESDEPREQELAMKILTDMGRDQEIGIYAPHGGLPPKDKPATPEEVAAALPAISDGLALLLEAEDLPEVKK